MTKNYGSVMDGSTNRRIQFFATKDKNDPTLEAIIGKLVYIDLPLGEVIYRAIGTVTNMTTFNKRQTDDNHLYAQSINSIPNTSNKNEDLRKSEFIIQSVFYKNKDSNEWKPSQASLPTSPITSTPVHILTEEVIRELVPAENPAVGFLRGADGAPARILVSDFGASTGATHKAIIGKSGSGKTQVSDFLLAANMIYEQHAILTIDPQGQWSSEKDMIFPLQNFARALGRRVDVLRVAEDIRLPLDESILGAIMEKLGLWDRFRRMGRDNREAFSREVASRLVHKNSDDDPRKILSETFQAIANSQSALKRIYAEDNRRTAFQEELLMLAGINETPEGDPVVISKEDEEDREFNWETILSAFIPVLSLFSSKNIRGGKRKPLSGPNGIFTAFFQARTDQSAPAPYLILDMSPNHHVNDQASLDENNSELRMQQMLDDDEVKATILTLIFEEVKKASERSYASASGRTLDTQIVFDEGWRYAPDQTDSYSIRTLSKKLEGYAKDTRKFGIGWTYILQAPSDLNNGIWKQLTSVYAGYGLMSKDVSMLLDLTEDKSQVELYKQFIPPLTTGDYPFIAFGPISPLIFTTAPMFFNAFNSIDEFLDANESWINKILRKRQLGSITKEVLQRPLVRKLNVGKIEPKTHHVGKKITSTKPQFAPVEPSVPDYIPETNDEGTVPPPPF